MNKKLFGLMAVMLLCGKSLYALTKFQVVERAAIAAGLVSGVVYFSKGGPLRWPLQKDASGNGCCGLEVSPNSTDPLIVSGVTFCASWPLFSWLASYYTAGARYEWAKNKFKELDENYLYRVRISDLNIGMVLQESGCESSELPLVTAFLALQSYDQTLVSISEELQKAIRDTGNTPLREKLEKLFDRVRTDLPRIRNNEAVVKGHDKTEWLEQWKLHQRQELEREKIRNQYAVHMVPQTHVVHHWR